MFCKNCGSEIEIQVSVCSKCGTPNFLYSPINGEERIRVVTYFLILVVSSIMLVGIIPLIITLCSIYILKKDKKFSSILMSEKLVNSYIIIISIGLMGLSIYEQILHYINFEEFIISRTYVYEPFFASFFVLIIIPLFKYLYFSILKKHREWILQNGIFADIEKQEKYVGSNNSKSKENCSIADELLKWSALLEKNMLTQEEFEKIKQNLLKKQG